MLSWSQDITPGGNHRKAKGSETVNKRITNKLFIYIPARLSFSSFFKSNIPQTAQEMRVNQTGVRCGGQEVGAWTRISWHSSEKHAGATVTIRKAPRLGGHSHQWGRTTGANALRAITWESRLSGRDTTTFLESLTMDLPS